MRRLITTMTFRLVFLRYVTTERLTTTTQRLVDSTFSSSKNNNSCFCCSFFLNNIISIYHFISVIIMISLLTTANTCMTIKRCCFFFVVALLFSSIPIKVVEGTVVQWSWQLVTLVDVDLKTARVPNKLVQHTQRAIPKVEKVLDYFFKKVLW